MRRSIFSTSHPIFLQFSIDQSTFCAYRILPIVNIVNNLSLIHRQVEYFKRVTQSNFSLPLFFPFKAKMPNAVIALIEGLSKCASRIGCVWARDEMNWSEKMECSRRQPTAREKQRNRTKNKKIGKRKILNFSVQTIFCRRRSRPKNVVHCVCVRNDDEKKKGIRFCQILIWIGCVTLPFRSTLNAFALCTSGGKWNLYFASHSVALFFRRFLPFPRFFCVCALFTLLYFECEREQKKTVCSVPQTKNWSTEEWIVVVFLLNFCCMFQLSRLVNVICTKCNIQAQH